MNKPSSAFFDTLGLYVYQYIDQDTLKPYYTGKGAGDRCWSHVKDKGFDPSDCYIVACNLERFFEKKDGAAFLLESFLIFQQTPDKNSVSGHYKECFIMKSLASLFNGYQSAQRDMHYEIEEFKSKYSEVLRGSIGYTESRGESFYLETGMRDRISLGIKVSVKNPNVVVLMKSNVGGEHFEELVTNVTAIMEGDYEIETAAGKNGGTLSFAVESEDKAVELWSQFIGK